MNRKKLTEMLLKENRFIFIGEEAYWSDLAIRILKEGLNREFAPLNMVELEHKEIAYADFVPMLEAVPFMDQRRVVLVKSFHFAEEGNVWSKSELADFEKRMKALAGDTVCILVNHSSARSKSAKLTKTLGETMRVLSFERLNQKELAEFVAERFEQGGKSKMPPSLIMRLIDHSGYLEKDAKINLYDIDNMVKKVEAYCREKGAPDKNDIDFLFGESESGDLFRLVDAIAKPDGRQAFLHYQGLKAKGEANIKIFVTVGKLFSTAVRVSYYMEENYTADAIAAELKKSPYAVRSAQGLLRRLGRAKLIDMLEIIVTQDYNMKSGLIDEKYYGELTLKKLLDRAEEA